MTDILSVELFIAFVINCYIFAVCEGTTYQVDSAGEIRWSGYTLERSCSIEHTAIDSMPLEGIIRHRTTRNRVECAQDCVSDAGCGSMTMSEEGGAVSCTLLSSSESVCDGNAGVIRKTSSNYCENGGTWVDQDGCLCPTGWLGPFCNIFNQMNECDSDPCVSGTCEDLINHYICHCDAGFQGVSCETDIDECASDPCMNGATCNDLVNSFTCSCEPGWEGTLCSIDTDECASGPCLNGASCNDFLNYYTCSCAPGWQGDVCQTDIDECDSGPCQYGFCTNLENAYSCNCLSNYYWTNCDSYASPYPVTLGFGSYGLVQVYNPSLDQWGSVCNDNFYAGGCSVVCKQLGYSDGVFVEYNNAENIGAILLDNAACEGTELDLNGCAQATWGAHDCDHEEDAACTCDGTTSPHPVRLEHGSHGYIQVYTYNQWGTVCDDSFNGCNVVCRQLGFPSGVNGASGSDSSANILLDEVVCTGSENDLNECSHSAWGEHDCDHSEDAACVCDYESARHHVSLTHGSYGLVQVYYPGNGEWGTVCDDWFRNNNNACTVVCRQLGYTNGVFVECGAGPSSLRILLDDIQCGGTEADLNQCTHASWTVHNCEHAEDAGCNCNGDPTC